MPRGAQLIDKLQRPKIPVDLAYGAILARARHSAGFSQAKMAEELHADTASIAWIETGRASPLRLPGARLRNRAHAPSSPPGSRDSLQKAFHSLEEILADQGIDLVLPKSKRSAATDRAETPPELRNALDEAATQAWARHRTGKDKTPFKGRWPKARKG